MKKQEDIKSGLGCHGFSLCDKDCPYGEFNGTGYDCSTQLCGDALILIGQLENRLNQAVEDMRMLGRMGQNVCPVCAWYNHGEGCKDKCIACITNKETDNFRWRGENEQEAQKT